MADKRVRAIKHGQWQGKAFRPGDETVMREDIARVYALMQQVEILGTVEPDAAPTAIAERTAEDRPGPAVETASAPKPERRRKK